MGSGARGQRDREQGATMSDCENARERLLAYYDGELPNQERRAVEAHLL
jgi:hypothetical protein